MTQSKGPRILLLSGWYFPDSVGGTEMYVYLLGKELQSLGWDVMIAAPSENEREHTYIHEGLPVYRYPVTLKPTKAELRVERPPEYFDVFTNWVKENKPDIVHLHSRTRGCGFYHAEFIKELGIPLVLTIHAADFMCAGGTSLRWGEYPCDGRIEARRCTGCWVKTYGLPWAVAWLIANLPYWISDNIGIRIKNRLGTALIMRRLLSARNERLFVLLYLAEHIVAVSNWIRNVLLLNGVPAHKISLCRHGLASQLIKTKTNGDFEVSRPMRIGFIGRFHHVKGVHILIQAVKRLPSDMRVELRIYGRVNSQEEESYFKKIQKIAKADKRILFCGEVTDKNRQEVLDNLDILAVPSIWFETGPFVVLEAFAVGVPIIGSNLGGIAELITSKVNGLLVDTGNIKAWVKSLRWIYEHPELIRDWIRNIPSVRTIKNVAGDMDRIYKSILHYI